jgi:transitional endoplasmic reticulum ATPase
LHTRLKVHEAYTEDVGRGHVRLDANTARSLSIEEGDVVLIIGRRKTFARCRFLKESEGVAGQEVARFDGLIRNNAGVRIGDAIEIRPARAVAAESIVIAPLEPAPPIDERYFTDVFQGYPLASGDVVMTPYFGGRLTYIVIDVKPKADVVMPGAETTFSVVQKFGFPSYEYVGGLFDEVAEVRERIELPLRHPEIYEKLGIGPPKCVLLVGPTGVGKTYLMRAIANELRKDDQSKNLRFLWGDGTNAPAQINTFKKTLGSKVDTSDSYDILFIDDLDIALRERDQTTLAALLSAMDNLDRGNRIIATATNPNSMDQAVRRRFSEITLNVPDKAGRLQILQIHLRHVPLEKGADLLKIASMTENLMGADLEQLCVEAGVSAVRRWIQKLPPNIERISPEILDNLVVSMDDFAQAFDRLRPKLKAS